MASAVMIPSAHTLEKQYRLLQMPVAIVAGAEDRLIERDDGRRMPNALAILNEAKPPEWAAFSLDFQGSCRSRAAVEIRPKRQ
jgi:hypothetical protein